MECSILRKTIRLQNKDGESIALPIGEGMDEREENLPREGMDEIKGDKFIWLQKRHNRGRLLIL